MQLDYHESAKCFTLRVPRQDKALVENLMTINGWDFSTSASDLGSAILFSKEPYAAVGYIDHATPFARAQLQGISDLVAQSWKAESNAHIKCPMDKELWPFQRAGVEYALPRRHTLVGDQPGCGKTETAICYANEINAKRVLVLCPASIRLQWADRIREWSTMPWPFVIYPIIAGRYGVHPQAAWTIVSYDLARTEPIGRALAQGLYDLIILDEAHYLKTIDSGRTRAIFGDHTGMCREPIRNDSGKITGYNDLFPALASRCGATMALTGTPLPNRPREMYTLARNLCLRADTPILTSNGVRPIIAVTKDDLLWDGEEWVRHDGLIFQGFKPTLDLLGIGLTAEHKVLSGAQWLPWSQATQDAASLSQVLATGLESIQLLAMASRQAGLSSWSNVPAAALLTQLYSTTCAEATHSGANPATTKFSQKTLFSVMDTAKLLLMAHSAEAFLVEFLASSPDATIQKIEDILGMAPEASVFGQSGSKTEKPSFGISLPCPVGMMHPFNLIEKIIMEAIAREISALFLAAKTCPTDELSTFSKPVFKNWKPVFDIVNAGPRHRFTILTEQGPLVVSNCFDSIDWMSEVDFNERFNPVAKIDGVRKDGSSYTFTKERAGRAGELQARLRANFMVRHLKRDVMPQLKLPVYDIVQVEETKAVKQVLEAESFLEIDPESFDGSDIEILGHVAVVRHQMGLAIAPQVADYAAMCIDGGEEKLVIFAWHKDVCDLLQQRLSRFGVLRIDGSTSPTQRKERVEAFTSQDHMHVMLGNTLALGTGTDGLQKVAAHALLAEPEWVPGNNEQAIDRLDRGGQTRTVQADLFVAPGSILQKILASALRKRLNTHLALDARAT